MKKKKRRKSFKKRTTCHLNRTFKDYNTLRIRQHVIYFTLDSTYSLSRRRLAGLQRDVLLDWIDNTAEIGEIYYQTLSGMHLHST